VASENKQIVVEFARYYTHISRPKPSNNPEKAFDRCSWRYYHSALIALNFGPKFRNMLSLLANEAHPPPRTVKINGLRSPPFQIHCGVP
jgi:hypothetical protein